MQPRRTAVAARRKYDWEGWFARRRFTLRRGTDYRTSTLSMAQQVRNAAAARGGSVQIIETADGLVVLFTPGEPARADAG